MVILAFEAILGWIHKIHSEHLPALILFDADAKEINQSSYYSMRMQRISIKVHIRHGGDGDGMRKSKWMGGENAQWTNQYVSSSRIGQRLCSSCLLMQIAFDMVELPPKQEHSSPTTQFPPGFWELRACPAKLCICIPWREALVGPLIGWSDTNQK